MLFRVEREEPGRLRLSGELDLATHDTFLAAARKELAEAGSLTLDLGDLTFMDSKGLRALLLLGQESAQGPVRLVAPVPQVRRVLEISGLDRFQGLEIEPVTP